MAELIGLSSGGAMWASTVTCSWVIFSSCSRPVQQPFDNAPVPFVAMLASLVLQLGLDD